MISLILSVLFQVVPCNLNNNVLTCNLPTPVPCPSATPCPTPTPTPTPSISPTPIPSPTIPPSTSVLGYGSNSIGGNGGQVCKFATEADLRSCLLRQGPRIVQPVSNDVVVFLTQPLIISGIGYSNFTLEGPAIIHQPTWDTNGVRIARGMADIIIRNINFQGKWPFGEFSHTNNAAVLEFDGTNTQNLRIVLDHITVCCGVDSAPDFYGGNKDVTIQYSLFHSSLHPMTISSNGARPEGDPDARERMTLFGNVFAKNGERSPQFRRGTYDIDYINNVVYDWRPDFYGNPFPVYTGYGVRYQDDVPNEINRLNFQRNKFVAVTGVPKQDCMEGNTPNCDGGGTCSAKLDGATLHFSGNLFTPEHPIGECKSTVNGANPIPRPYNLPTISHRNVVLNAGASIKTQKEIDLINEILTRVP